MSAGGARRPVATALPATRARPRGGRFIRGYHAELDARLAGYEITAFASVRLHAQGEPELREFEKQVLMWPLVREVYMLSGDMDYQLTCVAPDLSAFQEQVVGKLSALPNVASVKTTLVMRRVKHDPGVPIAIPKRKTPLSIASHTSSETTRNVCRIWRGATNSVAASFPQLRARDRAGSVNSAGPLR